MPGTRAGAMKARDTNINNDPDFYAKIGKKSWKNPSRSHLTGFAKLSKEQLTELARKGGKKTKSEYKTNTQAVEYETAESVKAIFAASEDDGPSISE